MPARGFVGLNPHAVEGTVPAFAGTEDRAETALNTKKRRNEEGKESGAIPRAAGWVCMSLFSVELALDDLQVFACRLRIRVVVSKNLAEDRISAFVAALCSGEISLVLQDASQVVDINRDLWMVLAVCDLGDSEGALVAGLCARSIPLRV